MTTTIQETVQETGDRVVGLTAERAELLRTLSARSERLVLVTDEGSCLTLPLRDALHGTGGRWEVRNVEHHRAAPSAQLITLTLSVRHSARSTTVLGRTAELAVERLTGAPPTSWGPNEPAVGPWDRTALTAAARERMPEPSRFVIQGADVIGTVLVRRTQGGLEEITTLEVAAGPEGSGAARTVVDQVPAVLDALSEETMPLFFFATTRTGRADLLIPPGAQDPPVPLTMLLGPPGVRQLEVDLDEAARRFGAVRVGRRRLPALRFPLDAAGDPGWTQTTAVARWLRAEEVVGSGT